MIRFFLFKLFGLNAGLFFCSGHNIVSGGTMFNQQFF